MAAEFELGLCVERQLGHLFNRRSVAGNFEKKITNINGKASRPSPKVRSHDIELVVEVDHVIQLCT